MRFKKFALFLLLFYLVRADLQGPPSEEKNKKDKTEPQLTSNERKYVETNDDSQTSEAMTSTSTSADDEMSNTHDSSEKKSDSDEDLDDEADAIASLLSQDFSSGAAIKIVKAPVYQEKEVQKVTEMLSTLVNSHVKLIKKIEHEIEDLDGSIATLNTEEEPEHIPTPEEIELDNLYEAGMKIINNTRTDKASGYALLQQAADKGHIKAQAKVAWAQLLGNPLKLNFEEAKGTFLRLAETGLPDAHMVGQ